MVGSCCSIKDKNCFQPKDFENNWFLAWCINSTAYLVGSFLFLMATSRSYRVTCPSPSLSNSQKNLLQFVFFFKVCPQISIHNIQHVITSSNQIQQIQRSKNNGPQDTDSLDHFFHNHASPTKTTNDPTPTPLLVPDSDSFVFSTRRRMDPTIPTPTACSTVTSSSVSSQAPAPFPSNILEISLISAQDLSPITKSMRTYATTWIHPSRKLTTRTDQTGHTNPTWNDKFAFRVDNDLLASDNVTLTVEIYTVSWFRDVLVGTVQVLINDLITPSVRLSHNHPKNTRFVALQVRRPSGTPQGILNMGIALLDSTMRSMPLNTYPSEEIQKRLNLGGIQQHKTEDQEEENRELASRIQLWRSLSVGSEVNDFPLKPGSANNGSMVNGSVCNGSTANGSEACSDIGPSASIVAAELAKKFQPPLNPKKAYRAAQDVEETGSSILEDLTIEEAKAKGYRFTSRRERWRKEMTSGGKIDRDDDFDRSELSSNSNRHSRRNSDGGLFSCFGNAYGIEFTIVCGASNNAGTKKLIDSKSRKKRSSEANSA